MKKVLIGCLGILLMLGLTVFWYLSRFDSEQDIPETAQSTLRETHTGPVLGFSKNDVNVWLGIPYAQPPVNDLRWRAPREPVSWSEPKNVTQFGEACPQGALGLSGSEDCLFLNIWSSQSEGSSKPVMFFIHGGGNVIGSADQGGLYDGQRFASEHEVVLVSINYRLGPLGWFSHPALRETESKAFAEEDNSGNYGTLDIIAGLKWVQKNIRSFGGDPDNVTIFGESAGGWNVMSMVVSPLASGLYHKAIVQSGGLKLTDMGEAQEYREDGGLPRSSREEMNRILQLDGRAANSDEAEQIQNAMSSAEISEYLRGAELSLVFGTLGGDRDLAEQEERRSGPGKPFILWSGMDDMPPNLLADGYVLPGNTDIFEVLSDPTQFNATPIMLGSNKNETKLFTLMDPWYTHRFFSVPVMTKNMEDYFQSVKYGSLFWKAIGVDEVASVLFESQEEKIFAYQFDWGNLRNFLTINLEDLLGGAHALELPFVFGNLGLLETALVLADSSAARSLSDSMMSYWAEFAYSGDPSTGRDREQTLWRPWTNAENGDRQILFDEVNAGGIRMSGNLVNFQAIVDELERDPILDEVSRCELANRMFPSLSHQVCGL